MRAKIAIIVFWVNLYSSASLSPADIARVNADLCENTILDAALSTVNGNVYFFKGDVFWKIICDRVDQGYPKSIKEVWNIDPPIDAAFTLNNGTSYIIKGTKFWKFTNEMPIDGHSRDYQEEWDRRFPDKIDAAISLVNSVAVYLINGPVLLKYTFEPDGSMANFGPNSTFTRYPQIKSLPQACLRRKDKAYFFTGKYSVQTTNKRPYISRPTSLEWLQCKNNKPLYINEVCCKDMRWRTYKTANVKGGFHCPSIINQYRMENPNETWIVNLTKRSEKRTENLQLEITNVSQLTENLPLNLTMENMSLNLSKIPQNSMNLTKIYQNPTENSTLNRAKRSQMSTGNLLLNLTKRSKKHMGNFLLNLKKRSKPTENLLKKKKKNKPNKIKDNICNKTTDNVPMKPTDILPKNMTENVTNKKTEKLV